MQARYKLSHSQIQENRPNLMQHSNQTRFPIYCILDNVRSMYNVGSIFRTSDGAKIKQLYLCGITAYPPRSGIYKTSLGAEESVPWSYYSNTITCIEQLKQKNIHVVAVEQTSDSISCFNWTPVFPMALIFGNEVDGVQDESIRLADTCIDIPMHGIKHSLNLAVSYGIATYAMIQKFKEQT